MDTQWVSMVEEQAVTIRLGIGQSIGTEMMARLDKTEMVEWKEGSQSSLPEEYTNYWNTVNGGHQISHWFD